MPTFDDVDPLLLEHWFASLQAGEVDAFQALFEAFTPRLIRFAQVTVPYAVAEDLVQDVLFDLWQRRESLAITAENLGPYLFGAVRNRALQAIRHQRVIDKHEDHMSATAAGMGTPPLASDAMLSAHEIETGFADALTRLTELQRAVLSLRWTHGFTYEQLAPILGITASSARQHASRAQRVLRPFLERYLDR